MLTKLHRQRENSLTLARTLTDNVAFIHVENCGLGGPHPAHPHLEVRTTTGEPGLPNRK